MKAPAIFVSGARGSGKTTLAGALCRGHPRFLGFDPLHNMAFARAVVTESAEDVRRRLIRDYHRGFAIVYRPPPRLLRLALSEISGVLLDVAKAGGGAHQVLFYAEELSLCFPDGLPAAERGFFDLALTGRNFHIALVGVAQRPALVGKAFAHNVDETYAGRAHGDADLAAVADIIGRGYRAALGELRNFEFIHKNHATGAVDVPARLARLSTGARN